MTEAVRTYLQETVATIEHKFRRRGHTTGKKLWEKKILDGAKKLLREEQSDLPLRTSDAELNAAVRRHTHAGFE